MLPKNKNIPQILVEFWMYIWDKCFLKLFVLPDILPILVNTKPELRTSKKYVDRWLYIRSEISE